MMVAKAFIYRFFAIFGLRIYLAEREEQDFMARSLFRDIVMSIIDDSYDRDYNAIYRSINRGMWQARNGFTTIHLRKKNLAAIVLKAKHAFNFNYMDR